MNRSSERISIAGFLVSTSPPAASSAVESLPDAALASSSATAPALSPIDLDLIAMPRPFVIGDKTYTIPPPRFTQRSSSRHGHGRASVPATQAHRLSHGRGDAATQPSPFMGRRDDAPR